jgi:hypothetical protein
MARALEGCEPGASRLQGGHVVTRWRLDMRFYGSRKLVAVAVPFAIVVGALTCATIPAHAIDSCTTNQALLAQANAAELEGDDWVNAEDVFIDDNNYEAVNYAYIQAGIAFKLADKLYAEACA